MKFGAAGSKKPIMYRCSSWEINSVIFGVCQSETILAQDSIYGLRLPRLDTWSSRFVQLFTDIQILGRVRVTSGSGLVLWTVMAVLSNNYLRVLRWLSGVLLSIFVRQKLRTIHHWHQTRPRTAALTRPLSSLLISDLSVCQQVLEFDES
jgi:hypothetical protein